MGERTCSVTECARPMKALGYCRTHYQRLKRTGDPATVRRHGSPPRPFWSLIDRTAGLDSCWPWTAARDREGYGRCTSHLHGAHLAHRAAFLKIYGYLPPVVMHACDNPPCCNPLHLLPGTQTDNLADMRRKGRDRSKRTESR